VKKVSPAIVVALIVLVFAGAILARVAIVSRLSGMPDAANDTLADAYANSEHPIVMWSVTSSPDEDAKGYAYSLATKQTTGPVEGFEGPGVVRFNQSTNLCDHDYQNVPFNIECNYNSVANVLVLTVYGMIGEEKWMQAYTIDLKDLGVFPSAAEGYLTPVAVADDKSAIYLGRRVETESYVAGLWRLDVPSGVINEISYVRDSNVYQYEINPATKTLVGVTFTPPEGLGESPTGPSKIVLIDLETGADQDLDERTKRVFENVLLSDDGKFYSVQVYLLPDDRRSVPETAVTNVATGERIAEFDGVVRDWFGDTMVVDRDGNLYLYDLATDVETQLTHETDVTVEYLGVIK